LSDPAEANPQSHAARPTARPGVPFTIPLADGPVAPAVDRVIAAAVLAAAGAAVWLLASIEPSPAGYDTHVQFGWPRCGWPLTMGLPCPTCGCTTAACLLVHGQPWQALRTQPFGALLALSGLLLGVHAALCLWRRRSFVDLVVRLPRARILLLALAVLLASWAYKCMIFVP